MRKRMRAAALFFSILLCANTAVFAAGAGPEDAVLLLSSGGGAAELDLRNDTPEAVSFYAETSGEPSGGLEIRVCRAGRTETVFEGRAAGLSGGRVLLCTLGPEDSAKLTAASSGAEETVALSVTRVPAGQSGGADRIRLLFFVCVWVALAVFGAYLVVAVRRRKREKE